jgi:hypothetical protein
MSNASILHPHGHPIEFRYVYTVDMRILPIPAINIDRTRLSGRYAGLAIASMLLHLIALYWASDNIGIPSHPQQKSAVFVANLHASGSPEPAALPKPKLQSRPATTIRKRPHVQPAPPETQTTVFESAAPASTVAGTVQPAPDPLPPPEDKAPAVSAKTADVASEPTAIHYKIDPAPSAELKYDVQALREGQTVYGRGKIHWQTDGGKYSIAGEAGVLFFTVLNFRSEGRLDDFGVAPVIYSEKRFRKSETNTHFNRDERNSISFSASTASYPCTGGEQDRASIIWQLVGIGRGDSEKFVPGAAIDLFVAGVRDAETWRIHVIGQEDIEVGTGKTNTWHIVRAPRSGSYDQQLDIWLAPAQQWYPVKLRYTETNGDYLDMSLSSLNMAQPASIGTSR